MDMLRFDFDNLMAPGLAGGVSAEQLVGDLAGAFERAHARLEEQRAAGVLGFFDLPYAQETVDEVTQLADGFAQWFEDVVVLGIGGSGLGARSLKDALLGPYWNDLPPERRHAPFALSALRGHYWAPDKWRPAD